MAVQLKRIYEPPAESDGVRVLVDRIWPRGVSKKGAALDLWAKDLAPSTGLRKWFNHDPDRWSEFRRRYRAELSEQTEQLRRLREKVAGREVTLLFATRNVEHNQAVVVKEVLENGLANGSE